MSEYRPGLGEGVVAGGIALAGIAALREGMDPGGEIRAELQREQIENHSDIDRAGEALLSLKTNMKKIGVDIRSLEIDESPVQDDEGGYTVTARLDDGEVIAHHVAFDPAVPKEGRFLALQNDLQDFSTSYDVTRHMNKKDWSVVDRFQE